jgi:hypothetical protein
MGLKKYSMITDIAMLNSNSRTQEEFNRLFNDNLFSDDVMWSNYKLQTEINGLLDGINSRMKYYMSLLSLGVYNVLENGPGKNIKEDNEIYLFSGFTEIGTVSKIGDIIMTNDYSINPSIFPNSVHHISLCYYTILKKMGNYCSTITDGLLTNFSFINFIKNRVMLKDEFIVVTGEEKATFFDYEIDEVLDIYPSFTAYKIIPDTGKGFCFGGAVNNIDELSSVYKDADYIFADKESYFDLKDKVDKPMYSDYPITRENPCGIMFRLAFPFFFNCKGKSIVVDKIMNQYYYFIVSI